MTGPIDICKVKAMMGSCTRHPTRVSECPLFAFVPSFPLRARCLCGNRGKRLPSRSNTRCIRPETPRQVAVTSFSTTLRGVFVSPVRIKWRLVHQWRSSRNPLCWRLSCDVRLEMPTKAIRGKHATAACHPNHGSLLAASETCRTSRQCFARAGTAA